jgi:hypothetical protein
MDRIATMRMELKHKHQLGGTDELQLGDVEEIYDSVIQSLGEHDEYPLYPTSRLTNTTRWRDVYEIHSVTAAHSSQTPPSGNTCQQYLTCLHHLLHMRGRSTPIVRFALVHG